MAEMERDTELKWEVTLARLRSVCIRKSDGGLIDGWDSLRMAQFDVGREVGYAEEQLERIFGPLPELPLDTNRELNHRREIDHQTLKESSE